MKVIRVGRCLDCPYIRKYTTQVERKMLVEWYCKRWFTKNHFARKIKDANAIPKFCKLEEVKE